MYQIVIARKLQGRGIFVTEDRNEPNMAQTPTVDGKMEERPVILGRKLAAKERRTLLETRNSLKDNFGGSVCHITPTGKEEKGIEGLCMKCPVCYTHGGLRSGKKGNYGRPGIVLYDDAFSLGDSDIETLTINAVSTKTQRTGTALASETFVFGGSFVHVITIKNDTPEILNLILDSILSTNSYGARSRHYGRMTNEIVAIFKGHRPVITSYELVSRVKNIAELKSQCEKIAKERGAEIVSTPKLKDPIEIMLDAHKQVDVQVWYKEVEGYLSDSKKK
ncbi:MAG: type I-D CRISPR-associated protein Cas7/Csc2 [Candidatus Thermoplasmatota archaeon]|nr:type I-D CRISPR-associated protein Cas7/Csc2 [Euryarchaeota archaeon]MBU4032735.1 type I-D CRISPR-associated protein Cas7/Csc2 [Candidatus Thermoplasmatota archaeon]MBU4071464.1 type I-D CRISPR-associated protein Cas7/Csc2 [Candidatus Thermoplasmatota archaeon]MBU4144273.1 type I-D CRISPR-associated protein Cas7/Csc2 [Candidatus Thermoplasmatota archaeon]MBU4592345.1 type I-D CRISPR-associated protein Cas7/Csc2 [Candidatus Thermoplasmatota archaeon]